MNSKAKRIIAIIGLAFMAIFSVSFVLFLFKPQMWNGVIAFITLASGILGLVSFLIIKLNQKAETEKEELENAEKELDDKEADEPEADEQDQN